MLDNLKTDLFLNHSPSEFSDFALKIFHFQYKNCPIYQKYVNSLQIQVSDIRAVENIPFLPISFFKTHKICSFEGKEDIIYYSSTTTGQVPSRHFVKELKVYQTSYEQGFQRVYGVPEEYIIIALLPSYLERSGSSLIDMAHDLIQQTKHLKSNFFKDIHPSELIEIATQNPERKILLLGVTYALLDFCEQIPDSLSLPNLIVMETGGMKGRRRELIREELHTLLQQKLGVTSIHSEYGMTELLSQAYSTGDGRFECPPWMKVITRDLYDPQQHVLNKNGAINVIDLANIYSCSFIATDDTGIVHEDGSFEITGRIDMSEIRGCNLMYTD